MPTELGEELTEVLVSAKSVRVERIVSTGQESPEGFWYDQDEHEWVVVLKGEAILRFDGPKETRQMKAGDHVAIAAHRRHRIDWTSSEEPTIWLAVFYR